MVDRVGNIVEYCGGRNVIGGGVFVEVECSQWTKDGENVCGDAFSSVRLPRENRLIAALADGLGSGVKANILATMTATMSLRFSAANRDLEKFSRIMMESLPVCRRRRISYSTVTNLDCVLEDEARVVEQGNPPLILIRNGIEVPLPRRRVGSETGAREMFASSFIPMIGDRVIICSDGVSQAGIGSRDYGFGWQMEGCGRFVRELLRSEPGVSARELALRVRNEALLKWPDRRARDDISCTVIYFRHPREALVLSGPPFDAGRDGEFARLLHRGNQRKIVCGGTTAQIVSRELNREVLVDMKSAGNNLPPASLIEGVDLVTEGILTLTRAAQYLEEGGGTSADPAGRLVGQLLESDKIRFVIGTRINEAHQDPSLPVDLEMRRNIIKRMALCLREKYLKLVEIEYI